MTRDEFQQQIRQGIPASLPALPTEDPAVSRAPERPMLLSSEEQKLSLHNALRYFPANMHEDLAPEFAAELARWGRIYMHRFRPDLRHARPAPSTSIPPAAGRPPPSC